MVVAPCTGHGEALRAAHDDVDAVIDDVLLVIKEASAEGQEAQGRQVAGVFASHERVRRELQLEELVIRHILIESPDDPITVSVGVGVTTFLFEDITLGVGVTRNVEPVPAPAFAEGWGGEESVDEFIVCLRVAIRDEALDLGGGGRQAVQHKVRATNQRFLRGIGRIGQAVRF